MDEYQQVMQELKDIKELVIELKKSIDARDNEINELKKLISNVNISTDNNTKSELDDVINSNDPGRCFLYALNHKDEDLTKLEQIILDSKDVDANYKWLISLRGSRYQEHLKIINDSNNPEYNYYAAVNGNLDDEEIKKIRIILLEQKNLEYIYQFACDLDEIYSKSSTFNGDVSDLEKAIIDGMDYNYYYKFCKKVKNANILLFQNAMLDNSDTDDIKAIFNFGVGIKGANIERCKERIIELYNKENETRKKEIISTIDTCEKEKIKCIFRRTFADSVVIK